MKPETSKKETKKETRIGGFFRGFRASSSSPTKVGGKKKLGLSVDVAPICTPTHSPPHTTDDREVRKSTRSKIRASSKSRHRAHSADEMGNLSPDENFSSQSNSVKPQQAPSLRDLRLHDEKQKISSKRHTSKSRRDVRLPDEKPKNSSKSHSSKHGQPKSLRDIQLHSHSSSQPISRNRRRSHSVDELPDEEPKSSFRNRSSSRHKPPSSKDIRLHSKSPSRQRIEDFMNDVKSRERSASTIRVYSRDYSPTARSGSTDDMRPSSTRHVRSTSRDGFDGSSCGGQDFLSKSERGPSDRQPPSTNYPSTYGSRKSFLTDRNIDAGVTCRPQRSQDFSSPVRNSPEKNTRIKLISTISTNSPEGRRALLKLPFAAETSISSRSATSALLASDNPESWFSAIGRRDWEGVEQLIRGYDYMKYTSSSSKPQKKLRVLKLLPSSIGAKGLTEKEEFVSPLLTGDSKGRTPLHMGCKEHMPWRMLQSMFFLERSAVSVLDDDDRLPLHLAVIANHDTKILDKLIHGNPSSLLHPDALTHRTPLGYAILRAEFKRDKTAPFMSWRKALNKTESSWQSEHREHWTNVKFLLDTFVSRRKLLSKSHDSTLLLECTRSVAPPDVMDDMISVSARIIQKDQDMASQLIKLLVLHDYPVAIIRKVLKICSETIPQELLIQWMRKAMLEHYDKGTITVYHEELDWNTNFRHEMIKTYKRNVHKGPPSLTPACEEWWDKLKFLLRYTADATPRSQEVGEIYLLHAACMVPESPPHLIDFLVRISPASRFEKSPRSGALPIHLLCKYWRVEPHHEKEACKTINMIVDGDVSWASQRYRNRTALHYSILRRQPWSLVQAIISLNPKTVHIADPWTRLYPFQLAGLSESTFSDAGTTREEQQSKSVLQVDMVYKLLRLNPAAIHPMMSCGSGDPLGDLGPVAQHVLSCCYSYSQSAWMLDRAKLRVLRGAISKAKIPHELREWYEKLRALIWRVYDMKNAGKRIVYMPHEEVFLLHAALSNGGTPPIVIELILELFPKAIRTPKPGTDQYPIHIAAESVSYTPMPFESVISMPSALEMIVLAYPRAVRRECGGRNVLQTAIRSGKLWNELKPILDVEPLLVKIRDRSSGLLSYQFAAAQENIMPLELLMQSKTFATMWSDRTSSENGLLLVRLRRDFDCDTLSTIYEMLQLTIQVGAKL